MPDMTTGEGLEMARLRHWGLRLTGVCAGIVLCTALLSPAQGQERRPQIPTLRVEPAGNLNGEVAVYEPGGGVVKRFAGLGEPAALLASGSGNFYVADRESGRVLEVTPEGQTIWAFQDPERLRFIVAMTMLPNGNLLLACGWQGLIEVNRQGAVVWEIPSPLQNVDVTGAVRLPDGSTVLTLRHRHHSLYWVPPNSTQAVEVRTNLPEEQRNFTRCAPYAMQVGDFLLWDNNWRHAYRCSLQNGDLVVKEAFPVASAWFAISDDAGDLFYTHEDPRFCRWSRAGGETCWQTVFRPLAAIPTADRHGYLVAYQRIADASWPESWPTPPAEPTIDWPRFWLWIGAAAGLVALLRLGRWPQLWTPAPKQRRTDDRDSSSTTENPHLALDVGTVSGTAEQPLAKGKGWVGFAAFAGAALGLALAVHGHLLMRDGFRPGWLGFYAGGALLTALALEAWRRLGLRERDPYWADTLRNVPDLSDWSRLVPGLLAVDAGSFLLFTWRNAGQGYTRYTDEVGLWAALLLLLLGICVRPISTLRPRARTWQRREVLFPAFAMLVGAVTIGYRLREVPANIHFDFVFYALEAYKVLQGFRQDIWQNGYVPAPAIGMVPEFLGLRLLGMGELGIRLGSALYGWSGILAVYLLGRMYRDSKTGLLAALFLAGNIPYIHFSRVPSNGEPATTALWLITAFAAAVRYGNPRLWVLSGLAGGYTFYLHPLGRTSLVACAVFGLVVLARSWRVVQRRWFGPILIILAIGVLFAPLVPLWLRNPPLLFPRVEDSLTVFKPSEGVNWETLRASLGPPLWKSFGWFFVQVDNSSQGTLSPGCNGIEAVLLAVGFCIALLEGFSISLLFLCQVFLVLLIFGAWAGTPPWYTRLLSTAPIAAVLMARAVMGFYSFASFARERWRGATYAFLVVGVTIASPALNLRTYIRHETGQTGGYSLHEMTAIGRRMRDLGPGYHYYLVTTHNPSWTVSPNGGAEFGELLPYMWDRRVREVRELETVLPFPDHEPVAVFLQANRFAADVGTLREWYPGAKVEEIHGFRGETRAGVVLIDPRKEPQNRDHAS
jgi:4-amino-4-deoxy-L-arabinose transferase-like glycosyltransferase